MATREGMMRRFLISVAVLAALPPNVARAEVL